MAIKRTTIVLEERYAILLESLPNKSRIINNLLALLFENINEDDLMRISYASNHNEFLRRELQNILHRNMRLETPIKTNKTKLNKIDKQTTKEKEPISKKPIPTENWENWW